MATVTETQTETVKQMETLHMKLKSNQSTSMSPRPPGSKRKTKLKLDPLRALEPARKKLSTLESQRVIAVLDDCIKRVGIVTIMPYILENLDRFSISLGSDLVKLLEGHRVIIESFESIKADATRYFEKERDILQAEYDAEYDEESDEESEDDEELEDEEEEESEPHIHKKRSKFSKTTFKGSSKMIKSAKGSAATTLAQVQEQAEAAMHNLQLVAKQMQHSTKNILRAFSLDTAAVSVILKDQQERNENTELLIKSLKDLREIIMGLLLTTPLEEADRAQYLKDITERERHNAKIIEKLEKQLATATDDKDYDIKKKNDVIRKLQTDLHSIERFSEDSIRRTKTEADKQQAADNKNSEGKMTKLQQEYNILNTQLQNLTQEHRDRESDMRKKKFRIETEVENWIQKYDVDMGVRQDEYEEIDAVYTEEKKQLNELEERFKTLEVEYNQIMEERRVARERREAAERELQLSLKAATTIQAFWRSFKVRKALKTKKKKGGKKGGKKKK